MAVLCRLCTANGNITDVWKVLGLSSGPVPIFSTEVYHGTLVDKIMKYDMIASFHIHIRKRTEKYKHLNNIRVYRKLLKLYSIFRCSAYVSY
jgi:hypothetical protein